MTGLIVFFNVTGFLDDDSLAEEVVEEVLDLALDIDVDLSDGCGDCDD
jgi:translation elongation factor EF-Tu-like GTPase